MRILFLALSVTLVFLGTTQAQQVILVNQGESIQQAIETASQGDTVRVASGTFDESLFINRSIVLQGAGMFNTVLTGGDNGSRAYDENRTILVYAPCVIDGFAIKQASRSVDENHNSMAILLESAGGTVIRNCKIENHVTGIYISGSANNVIEDNILSYCGNGVLFGSFMFDSDNNTIQNNRITNNGIAEETDDAGIKLISNYTGDNNVVTSNDIVDNTIGINNLTTNTIDAMGNWWGSATGPNNSTNTDGTGNSVSGFVLFENWSDSENNIVLSAGTQISVPSREVLIYPNPADEIIYVAFELDGDANVTLRIMDLQGRTVYAQKSMQLFSGGHQVDLNTQSLKAGVYVVNLDVNGERNLYKLVVR